MPLAMKRSTNDNKLIVGVTLPPELKARVVALAERREWTVSKAGSYLIRLGLERLDLDEEAVRKLAAEPQKTADLQSQSLN